MKIDVMNRHEYLDVKYTTEGNIIAAVLDYITKLINRLHNKMYCKDFKCVY